MTDQLETLTRALADRYRVDGELGRGGMAIVYNAHDLKHGRAVAIKVLRPEIAVALGAERFLREIQIEAQLSHPHILPLYDSGDADGVLYYVMPFVEGESLRDRIEREQQLSYPDAVQIAREVADALTWAHSHGFVHRDIKPENILLEGGHVLVADFGIARAISAAGTKGLTETGMAIGTPAYMSPEQASGAPGIDGRTDIYSLGCVLYEMVAGQVPFMGPTPMAILARHSMDAVPSPHTVRQSLPEEIEDIILRAMEKSPADRFRTANEFSEALTAVPLQTGTARRTGVRRPTRRHLDRRVVGALGVVVTLVLAGLGVRVVRGSADGDASRLLDHARVAVLYFDDLSPDHRLREVADGYTEALIQRLKQVRALSVVSANGVAAFRDAQVSRDSIARALGVGSLIVGSLEPQGDRLHVGVRLVDGDDGVDVDRASFDVPAGDLLGAGDSLVEQAVRILRQWVGEEVRVHVLAEGTRNADAWLLARKGERALTETREAVRRGEGDLDARLARADSLFAAAEALDPDWGEPTSLRARVAITGAGIEEDPWQAQTWLTTAIGHAERALQASPSDARALEMRGTARFQQWGLRLIPEPDRAEGLLLSAQADLEAAVRADPTSATARAVLSRVYTSTGNLPGAALEATRAYEEDAYLESADAILDGLFWSMYNTEQHAHARRWCDEGYRRFPRDQRFVECQLWVMTTPAAEPDVDRAWALVGELDAIAPEGQRIVRQHRGRIALGGVLARADLADSARAVLMASRLGPDKDPTRVLLWYEAYIRTLLGDSDESFELLRQYLAANPDEDHGAGEAGEVFWYWRGLSTDPRWAEMMGAH